MTTDTDKQRALEWIEEQIAVSKERGIPHVDVYETIRAALKPQPQIDGDDKLKPCHCGKAPHLVKKITDGSPHPVFKVICDCGVMDDTWWAAEYYCISAWNAQDNLLRTAPENTGELEAIEDLIKQHDLMEMCEENWHSHPGWNCIGGFATREEIQAEKKYKAARSAYEYRLRGIIPHLKRFLTTQKDKR